MCLQLKVKDVAYAVLYSSKISDFLLVSYFSENCEIQGSYRKQKSVSTTYLILKYIQQYISDSMEESTLILAKRLAEQGLQDDSDHAAEAMDGSPKPLRKMQGKLQGFR